MNLDDLLQLLFFFVFIVVPLLSRAGRRRGQSRKSAPKNRPQQPASGQGRASRQPRPRSAQTPQTSTSTSGDEFSKRLEEARRRVREAVEGQSVQGRTPEASPATGQESAGDLFRPTQPSGPSVSAPSVPVEQLSTPNTPSTTRPRSLVRERPVSSSFLPSESETATGMSKRRGQYAGNLGQRKKTGVSKPLQVQRSLRTKRAKLRGPLLQFGEDDLMRGIIWKQILDEPRAKESWRQQSQRR